MESAILFIKEPIRASRQGIPTSAAALLCSFFLHFLFMLRDSSLRLLLIVIIDKNCNMHTILDNFHFIRSS